MRDGLADATIHDRREARGFGARRGLFIRDPQLEPQDLGADPRCFIGDRRCVLRATEDIDDVDSLRNVGKRGVDRSAENARFVRRYWNDLKPGGHESFHDAERWPIVALRCANDGDGATRRENRTKLVVGRIDVAHAQV